MLEQRSLFRATAASPSRIGWAVVCDCGYWHCRPAWSGAEGMWLLLSPARKPADRTPPARRSRSQEGADSPQSRYIAETFVRTDSGSGGGLVIVCVGVAEMPPGVAAVPMAARGPCR